AAGELFGIGAESRFAPAYSGSSKRSASFEGSGAKRLRARHRNAPHLIRPLTGNSAVEVIKSSIVPDDAWLVCIRFINASWLANIDQDLVDLTRMEQVA